MSAYLIIILNLFILESLLSVDNAAVLAVMVRDLPAKDQSKALRYGIGGAFLFRGLSLFVASWLIKIVWLKILGGAYLLYLVHGHFHAGNDTLEEGIDKKHNKIFGGLTKHIGLFWSTVLLVELMDMAFSIDNIFAAVAMTENYYLIITGVFIGIIAMRFVAAWFVKLINKYPSLETSAFVVIGLLALKLIVSGIMDYTIKGKLKPVISGHTFDFIFSGIMMLIFFIPIIFKNAGLKKR